MEHNILFIYNLLIGSMLTSKIHPMWNDWKENFEIFGNLYSNILHTTPNRYRFQDFDLISKLILKMYLYIYEELNLFQFIEIYSKPKNPLVCKRTLLFQELWVEQMYITLISKENQRIALQWAPYYIIVRSFHTFPAEPERHLLTHVWKNISHG